MSTKNEMNSYRLTSMEEPGDERSDYKRYVKELPDWDWASTIFPEGKATK